MKNKQFLLYGANGYTGKLIAHYAASYGLVPILAGRREEELKPMAEQLNLSYKVISLDRTSVLESVLREVAVVIHAAGPFDVTAKPMVEACLRTGTHYLDINGDLAVFKMLKEYDQEAKEAGIMVMSGVGFDVVPTDCLALFLKKSLPEAVSLQLAFATPGGSLSHGTAITTITKLGEPGAIRKNGNIIQVPVGDKGMMVDFGSKKLFVMAIPWGDVFTAYETTGIKNIEAFTNVSRLVYWLTKFQFLFNWLLRKSVVRSLFKKIVKNNPPGLNDEKRAKATSIVWGKVSDKEGNTSVARLYCPDAYTLTAYTSLLIAQKIMLGNYKTGYQTPAGAYGENLIMEIEGVRREVVK